MQIIVGGGVLLSCLRTRVSVIPCRDCSIFKCITMLTDSGFAFLIHFVGRANYGIGYHFLEGIRKKKTRAFYFYFHIEHLIFNAILLLTHFFYLYFTYYSASWIQMAVI